MLRLIDVLQELHSTPPPDRGGCFSWTGPGALHSSAVCSLWLVVIAWGVAALAEGGGGPETQNVSMYAKRSWNEGRCGGSKSVEVGHSDSGRGRTSAE